MGRYSAPNVKRVPFWIDRRGKLLKREGFFDEGWDLTTTTIPYRV